MANEKSVSEFVLNVVEKEFVKSALDTQIQVVTRAMNKYPSGSAMHYALSEDRGTLVNIRAKL